MAYPWSVRPLVESFEPYQPGLSMEEIRQRYGLSKVVKMASNENPFGVSPKVAEVIRNTAAQAHRYPQSGNPRLVRALASYYAVDAKRIVVGNGSDEIIDLLIRVKAEPGINNVVAFQPCFGLYTTQTVFHGCELRQTPLNSDFTHDFDGLLSQVDENTSLVLITSPDNPSGRLAPREKILEFAHKLPEGCLLVVDEAYIEFAGAPDKVSVIGDLDTMPNLAVMRTFSKVYALAGLRIGYIILPEHLADCMWRVRLPFSLNIIAQEAAIAALTDAPFREKSIAQAEKGRAWLTEKLTALGFEVIPSHSNFIMVKPPCSPKDLNAYLLENGYIIRSLSSYGLPEYLRISVGTDDDNHELISLISSFPGLK
ncbi:MAG: histidinol-phosphate transaminase [Mailhella sp.]|nr:histidinol-phosphate transaminase [Mailhella sp.]